MLVKTAQKFSIGAGVAVLLVASQGAMAGTTAVTLAGLPVDQLISDTAVDPGSGVQFSNATQGGFIVDSWNASDVASLPVLNPGLVLSTEGFVGGGGVSVPFDFGFTMTLPHPADAVNLEMAYAVAASPFGSIELDAYDSVGNLVTSFNSGPLTGFFQETPIALSTSGDVISSVVVTPTDLFDAFGQISFTDMPEPSSLGLLAAGAGMLIRRRRTRSIA